MDTRKLCHIDAIKTRKIYNYLVKLIRNLTITSTQFTLHALATGSAYRGFHVTWIISYARIAWLLYVLMMYFTNDGNSPRNTEVFEMK